MPTQQQPARPGTPCCYHHVAAQDGGRASTKGSTHIVTPHVFDPRRCGPFDYKVGGIPDDNKPRNILEEIVWYKAKEIDSWRDKVPLAMLKVRACACQQQAANNHGHKAASCPAATQQRSGESTAHLTAAVCCSMEAVQRI
jgi:hypothetical protein